VTPAHAPPAPLASWGLKLDSSKLLAGLSPWLSNPDVDESVEPLSVLGHFADNIYKLGPLSMADYRAQLLEFVDVAFPKGIKTGMKEDVARFLEEPLGGAAWDSEKSIWQTDKDNRHAESREVGTWKSGQAQNEGWKWDLETDA
jgi:alpha 1,6-mannosyltransferase